MPENVRPGPTTCVGGEQITALTASAGFAAIPAAATWALIKPRGQGVFLRLAGGAATSADMAITVDTPVEITSRLSDVRVLQQGATAMLDVWYFG